MLFHTQRISYQTPAKTISRHVFTRKSRKPFCLSVPFSMSRKAQRHRARGKEALQDFRFPGSCRKQGGGFHSCVCLYLFTGQLATWGVTEFKERRHMESGLDNILGSICLCGLPYTLYAHADKQRTLSYHHGTVSGKLLLPVTKVLAPEIEPRPSPDSLLAWEHVA